jgi:hypothetical protein
MHQRSICLFLAAMRLAARVVNIELQVVRHEKPVGDSTVPKYFPFVRFGEQDLIQTGSDNTANADLANQAILQTLALRLVASIRPIFRTILLSKSTICMSSSQSIRPGERSRG